MRSTRRVREMIPSRAGGGCSLAARIAADGSRTSLSSSAPGRARRGVALARQVAVHTPSRLVDPFWQIEVVAQRPGDVRRRRMSHVACRPRAPRRAALPRPPSSVAPAANAAETPHSYDAADDRTPIRPASRTNAVAFASRPDTESVREADVQRRLDGGFVVQRQSAQQLLKAGFHGHPSLSLRVSSAPSGDAEQLNHPVAASVVTHMG